MSKINSKITIILFTYNCLLFTHSITSHRTNLARHLVTKAPSRDQHDNTRDNA